METIKQLGIYIDYTNAFLMELIKKMIVSRNIEFENNERNEEINFDNQNNPLHINNKGHLQSAYFIELSDIIRNYDQVVLFGPNEAKNELFKLLEFDHNFDNVKVQNINTDKMSEKQMHNFLKEFYSKAM
jgi:predicted RNA-binding protein Jag